EARMLADQSQLRLLEMAISRLNDMVVITEAQPKGLSGPQIVFVNDAFERYTGYSREEAIGNTPRFLWGPGTLPATLERIATALANWQAIRTEVAITTKSGTEIWLEVDIAPMADNSGKITHWVAVERDITGRRQQQQEILSLNSELESRVLLRTSQLAAVNMELATVNKELESFAYSVSHDLRSPLNTIDGFSRLLVKHDGERVSERGRHYLDRIHASVKQMGHLIDGLLVLAHLSREEVVYENIDLSAMARQVNSQCREREPERELHIHIHDGLTTMGDSRLLFAVLQNLLSNAWKFSSKRPVTHIEVGSQTDENGGTTFFVKDNGAGFDMVFAPKLFGTFERLHSPGDFPGTGIGLATVRRVIERHGGRVWAEAVPDQGASFYFTLGRPADTKLTIGV
ncbi:MAG: PAS domain S-box protein, partial [Pseudomonadota bacterium]